MQDKVQKPQFFAAYRPNFALFNKNHSGHQYEQKLPNGLFDGHAYSMLGAHLVTDKTGKHHRLVEIRNPWGNELEWTGNWSDDSNLWNTLKLWL